MDRYHAYTLEDVLRLTIRNYLALRQHIPRLRRKDLADATRSVAFAHQKNVQKIIEAHDPPPSRLT